MADLPSSFWGGWITVLTLVSLAGLAWLLYGIYFAKSRPDEQEHVIWDETLNEGVHPAPIWWFWLILALMVFSVIYLILYPGLGTYSGVLNWSQSGRLDQRYSDYERKYGELREFIASASLADLQEEELVMRSAYGIFDRNCAACHGKDGGGQAALFPDLMDSSWQWGGNPAQIEQSIRAGRQASMPGWMDALGETGVRQLIDYLRALEQGVQVADDDPGKQHYRQICMACHNRDGTGNPLLGAPDITDGIWLYGSSDEALFETIANGRNGTMPAFEGRLDEVQIRMLVAWLTKDRE